MRRNCNLELRLVPPCVSFSPEDCSTPNLSMGKNNPSTEEKQQLTIFYNGKVTVSDATELQARALIYLANRAMEEKTKTPSPISKPSSPLMLKSQNGLSMKRSLQRFLQKRNNRNEATSPYHRR